MLRLAFARLELLWRWPRPHPTSLSRPLVDPTQRPALAVGPCLLTTWRLGPHRIAPPDPPASAPFDSCNHEPHLHCSSSFCWRLFQKRSVHRWEEGGQVSRNLGAVGDHAYSQCDAGKGLLHSGETRGATSRLSMDGCWVMGELPVLRPHTFWFYIIDCFLPDLASPVVSPFLFSTLLAPMRYVMVET